MAESSGSQHLNRRQSPRSLCAGAVEILQRGSRWEWGRVNDISHGGCYIEILQLLPIGTEAQLQLTIADTLLNIAAKVVSNDPGSRGSKAGVRLCDAATFAGLSIAT